jgi:hydroxyethylthiazole kinase-like uncharacterized protein yjeF
MIPIVTPIEMREIDANAADSLEDLIARAGWHIARRARALLGGVYGRRVTVIAGPGNNGADGRAAAGLLRSWGVHVTVVTPDIGHLPTCDLVIDGAFGTGMNRPYQSPLIPDSVPVLAIDTPSGVDGLTGELLGKPISAQHTVTFAALKPGLLLTPGSQFAGEIEVVDIGLDTASANAWMFTESDARHLLPLRSHDDHKWKRSLYVVGGSAGMYGAPLLASQAALRAGCGIVWCAMPGQKPPAMATEVVFRELEAASWHTAVTAQADRFGAIVAGCGLGLADQAQASLRALIAETRLPMVIDGDGLRLLGQHPTLRSNIVLTPHDGEFTSLAGEPPRSDRFDSARSLAAATGATVLLKGPLTIIARPDGHCLVSSSGDSRLATAGSGDVLAGVIGSYLAAGLEPDTAAALGAWMHGQAGLSQTSFGMVASDLIDGLATVAARLVSVTPHGEPHASN